MVVGVLALVGIPDLRASFISGLDLEIPLRAATNWSTGAAVYPPSAMLVQHGPGLPYLYPPFLLPLLTPLAALPRDLVIDVWLVVCLVAAVWTCRRLGIPWPAVPFLLAWPPFGEGLIVGNVQILLFAAFVAVFYEPGAGAPQQRVLRRTRDLSERAARRCGRGPEVHPGLARAVPRAPKLQGGGPRSGRLRRVALATLPFTGLAHLRRLAGPAGPCRRPGLDHRRRIGDAPRRNSRRDPDRRRCRVGAAGARPRLGGMARNRAASSPLRVPTATRSCSCCRRLLTIRRDLAIPIGILFLGVYHGYSWWLAWLIVYLLLLASTRWTWLRAPRGSEDRALPSGAAPARPPARGRRLT